MKHLIYLALVVQATSFFNMDAETTRESRPQSGTWDDMNLSGTFDDASKRLSDLWQNPEKQLSESWQATQKKLSGDWQAAQKRLSGSWESLFGASDLNYQKEEDKMRAFITSAHTRLFSKDDLFKEKPDTDDVPVWVRLIGVFSSFMEKFVPGTLAEKIPNSTAHRNKLTLEDATKIATEIGYALPNIFFFLWHLTFNENLQQSRETAAARAKYLAQLKGLKPDLDRIIKAVESLKIATLTDGQRIAKNAVFHLLVTEDATIDALLRHYTKKLAQKAQTTPIGANKPEVIASPEA